VSWFGLFDAENISSTPSGPEDIFIPDFNSSLYRSSSCSVSIVLCGRFNALGVDWRYVNPLRGYCMKVSAQPKAQLKSVSERALCIDMASNAKDNQGPALAVTGNPYSIALTTRPHLAIARLRVHFLHLESLHLIGIIMFEEVDRCSKLCNSCVKPPRKQLETSITRLENQSRKQAYPS
jgi:hypothetical protein